MIWILYPFVAFAVFLVTLGRLAISALLRFNPFCRRAPVIELGALRKRKRR